MKKTTLLMGITLVATSGMASSPAILLTEGAGAEKVEKVSSKSINDLGTRMDRNENGMRSPMKVSFSNSPTPEGVVNDNVYNQDNGNVAGALHSNLYRSGSGYRSGGFMASYYVSSGFEGKYLLDEENGEIYIYNPITRYSTDSYIKGSIDKDGNITVKCPQMIVDEVDKYGDPWKYYVMNCELNEDNTAYEPVEGNLDLHYTLKDGVLSLNEGSVAGMYEYVQYYYYDYDLEEYVYVPDTYFYDWTFYADLECTMVPFDEEPVEPGKELDLEKWTLAFQKLGQSNTIFTGYESMEVEACIDGDTLWVRGVDKDVENSWMKGEIVGDKVIFKASYLFHDSEYGYFEFLIPGVLVYDDYEEEYVFQREDEVALSIDMDKKLISGKDGETLIINVGRESIYYVNRWINPVMKPVDSAAPVAAPMTPVFCYYYPVEDDYEGSFAFYVSDLDVNYNPLDTDNLYYMILIDGEPYEFTMEDLDEVYSEDMGEDDTIVRFPWDFDSYNVYDSGTKRIVDHYFEGYETIGAQILYVAEDGETIYSDPLVYNVNSGEIVGVKNVADSKAGIVETIFTGLDGVRVAHPEKGIYIMTMVYEDGSRKSIKIAR